jgi:excisionase family DNA binding protein
MSGFSTTQSQESSESDVLGVKEVAALLAVSKPVIYDLCHLEEIPCRRVGRKWRFSKRAVIAWLAGEPVSKGGAS